MTLNRVSGSRQYVYVLDMSVREGFVFPPAPPAFPEVEGSIKLLGANPR